MGIKLPKGPEHTYYYALIDMGRMAREKYGETFANHIKSKYVIEPFLLKLAKDKFTICLLGDGFAGPKWSLRGSLANLETEDYIYVGKNISKVMQEYYEEFVRK